MTMNRFSGRCASRAPTREEVRREQAELRALLADESGYHEAAVHALLADSGACPERVSGTQKSYGGLKVDR